MNSIEQIKLHFTYCATIGTGIVIFLATDRWTGQNNFTEYLANAATMTSLFLGVIAIFYSMVSNGDLSKTVGSISQAANEVNAAKTSISEISTQSKNNAIELQGIAASVSASIESLKSVVHQFESHAASVQTSIGMLPERLGSIEAKLMQGTPTSAPTDFSAPKAEELNSEKSMKLLLRSASAYGGLYIFAASIAFRKGALLNLEGLRRIIGAPVDYLFGFAVGLSAANIIPTEKNQPPILYALTTCRLT